MQTTSSSGAQSGTPNPTPLSANAPTATPSADGGSARAARFLERLQSSLSHDLRTPLGAIVNYGAVLESPEALGADDARDLGRRIRASAQRATRMLELTVGALTCAARPWRPTPTSLSVLLGAIAADVTGHALANSGARAMAPNSNNGDLVDVDAEVLGYAWRAYVAVESDARGGTLGDLELVSRREPERIVVELSCLDGAPAPLGSVAATPRAEYLRHSGGPDRLEAGFGLALAEELVRLHGGALELAGRAGASSLLRLSLPRPA